MFLIKQIRANAPSGNVPVGGGWTRLARLLAASCLLVLLQGAVHAAITTFTPNPAYTIARNWSERALEGIRMDTPHPPGQARNLFSFSVCMYDAWAAYDATAVGFAYRAKHTAADVAAARREAISYATYRMMLERHAYSRTATNQATFNPAFMVALGYDPNNETRDPSTPAGVGNRVYDAVSAWFLEDGSRQTAGVAYPAANPPVAYPDYPVGHPRRYAFVNPPMNPSLHGIDDGTNHTVLDINRWQRLIVANSIDQNGFPQNPLQGYLGAQWLWVRPFALGRNDADAPWIDPGPPPFLGTVTDAEFKANLVAVIRASSELSVDDGVTVDISPASVGNNSLGANDGHGYAANPITGLPYTPNVVLRGDFTRSLTEFWADGPTSETPPGHWNAIANHVSDVLTSKRIGGVGAEVDALEWDVKLYLALNAALHDAACAAWSVKRYYNGWRPLSAIRYCGGLGQCSDPNLPSYHTNGLPLVPGLIELVTAESAMERHAGLTPGKIALLSWPGQPEFPEDQVSHVQWVHAEDWTTYQKKTFVTPGFPGYISGHSTFSRAAAEIMKAFTGSPWFPGGMGSYTITKLVNESGPTQPVTLQWASYYDAADQVGLSRIWGGIHPPADDFAGRRVGSQVGLTAWNLVQRYYDGSVLNSEVRLAARSLGREPVEVRFNTVRGLYYKLLTAERAEGPYSDGGKPGQLAWETWVSVTNTVGAGSQFFRVLASPVP